MLFRTSYWVCFLALLAALRWSESCPSCSPCYRNCCANCPAVPSQLCRAPTAVPCPSWLPKGFRVVMRLGGCWMVPELGNPSIQLSLTLWSFLQSLLLQNEDIIAKVSMQTCSWIQIFPTYKEDKEDSQSLNLHLKLIIERIQKENSFRQLF